MKYVRQHRLLGLIFDAPRLLWGPHFRYLDQDTARRMDLLKHMASPNCGVSRKFLRLFYCMYIRAKMDYGCILYSNASVLTRLDVLQNGYLRLFLGARRTTPIVSLEAEARLPTLSVPRKFLLVYAVTCGCILAQWVT